MDVWIHSVGHFPPGVALGKTLGMEKPPVHGLSSLLVLKHPMFDVGQADALDPGRGRSEIWGPPAIDLKEGPALSAPLSPAPALA